MSSHYLNKKLSDCVYKLTSGLEMFDPGYIQSYPKSCYFLGTDYFQNWKANSIVLRIG